MPKYTALVPIDWISGNLRYGYMQFNIESETEMTKEDIIAYVNANDDDGEVKIDGFDINDHGELMMDDLTYEEIKEETTNLPIFTHDEVIILKDMVSEFDDWLNVSDESSEYEAIQSLKAKLQKVVR